MHKTRFGSGRFERRVVSLGEIARNAYPQLREAISPRAELRLSVDPDAPLVFVDRASIERMLLHLVINAARAVRNPHGAVEIGVVGVSGEHPARHPHRAPVPATPGARAESEFVRLTVADNGEGMDAASLHDVMRWLREPKSAPASVGLGLRLVRGIVQAHAGHMSLEARPRGPTTVRIDIPALAQDGARDPPHCPGAGPSGSSGPR